MGGHAAWRKRVARGETAKGMGGAIMRHRPHLGRKGKDLLLNRKGHIGGGNPKKKPKNKEDLSEQMPIRSDSFFSNYGAWGILVGILAAYGVIYSLFILIRK